MHTYPITFHHTPHKLSILHTRTCTHTQHPTPPQGRLPEIEVLQKQISKAHEELSDLRFKLEEQRAGVCGYPLQYVLCLDAQPVW